MTNNSRVTHAVRGYTMKFGQVQKRIAENSCFVWVKYGETFRDATIAEAAQMRKANPGPKDECRVGLGLSGEIAGCRYRQPANSQPRTEIKRLAKSYGLLVGAEIHLKASILQNESGISLLKNNLQEIQANQFCQAHAS